MTRKACSEYFSLPKYNGSRVYDIHYQKFQVLKMALVSLSLRVLAISSNSGRHNVTLCNTACYDSSNLIPDLIPTYTSPLKS